MSAGERVTLGASIALLEFFAMVLGVMLILLLGLDLGRVLGVAIVLITPFLGIGVARRVSVRKPAIPALSVALAVWASMGAMLFFLIRYVGCVQGDSVNWICGVILSGAAFGGALLGTLAVHERGAA